ncbi:MAG: LysR family transcriptional regulator [Herbaspirillum sp.]|jgi:DNA-binding transcriptional LysR family regulator|nr:LysR family transcriptional regulator [Herbaspirillum sp.]
MTLEQLRIFVEVAERQHLTQAAAYLYLTPSAVSSAIRALEDRYGVPLFNRVGRRIETTETGRAFLIEAKSTLAGAAAAERMLSEMGGLQRGSLRLQASQTIASYHLPPLLVAFQQRHPAIEIQLTVGNTQSVTEAVLAGAADLGFIEGHVENNALTIREIGQDRLAIVVSPRHPWADGRKLKARDLTTRRWTLREAGSGTRSAFAEALRAHRLDPSALDIALTLPSNEALLSAIGAGDLATAVSELAAAPLIDAGKLARANFTLPPRSFYLLHHRQRYRSKASLAMEAGIGTTDREQ